MCSLCTHRGGHSSPRVQVPDYGTEEVADHAMSLILALFRRTYFAA